jgi:hypothetical protein
MGLETLKVNVYGIAVLFVVYFGSENCACVLIQVHGLWELWRRVVSGAFGVWKKEVLVAKGWSRFYSIL